MNFQIKEAKTDIVFSGLGWITVQHRRCSCCCACTSRCRSIYSTIAYLGGFMYEKMVCCHRKSNCTFTFSYMHDTWFEEHEYRCKLYSNSRRTRKAREAVESLKLLGCSGWNVTFLIKTAIIPFLDEIDDSAKGIGAVNTVVKTEDGRFVGYNTDGLGFIRFTWTKLVNNIKIRIVIHRCWWCCKRYCSCFQTIRVFTYYNC